MAGSNDLTQEAGVSADNAEKYCHDKAWPLPRLTKSSHEVDKYDVIIAGAGPAGLLLRLLLGRYGLGDESVLCVDPKTGPTMIGHADGLHGRTMEMLASLGLENDVLQNGRQLLIEVAYVKTANGLKNTLKRPAFWGPARYGQLYCLHQGRIEGNFLQDLMKYSKQGIEYGSAVSEIVIDEADADYPVSVTVATGSGSRTLRAKYVVGADGAHSVVRRCANVEMIGDTVDEIWGVIDFVPETNFPHIRNFVRFTHENEKMVAMIIAREKMSDGNWLLRIYIEMSAEGVENGKKAGDELRDGLRRKKAEIKKEHILEKIQELFKPYHIRPKPGTQVIWWTTYNVGQRLAEQFTVNDSHGCPRVFLVGDACHTHSPRQGQGMNISMQDAYYLSWRLAYAVSGISKANAELLKTYEEERRPWAERVLTSDKRWNQGTMSWDNIMEEMKGQATGCGVEEKPGFLISTMNDAVDWQDKDLLLGVLRTGRRLFNVRVTRWADGTPIDLHDDFASDGRYRVLMLASKDFPNGRSRTAVEQVCGITRLFAEGVVEAVFLHPHDPDAEFGWDEMPGELKNQAEMRLHCADASVYATYCVDQDAGAIAVVRPDGIVCITVGFEQVAVVRELLERVLVSAA